MKLKCKQALCLWRGRPNLSMTGDHIRASCPKCGNYLKFVRYMELDSEDLKNLQAWQKKQVCNHEHEDGNIIQDQIEEYLGDFNYCPGCGRRLRDGKS